MKKTTINIRKFFPYFVLFLIFTKSSDNVLAQQVFGISYGYEYFPYVKLADPIPGVEDLEIQASAWNAGAAFPLKFAEGKIMMLNRVQYQRVDFHYKNFPAGGTEINQAQSIQFTSFLIDSLSEKWGMIVVMTPGLASDFEGKLSMDDFTLQAVFGFIRKYTKNFKLGFGLAYTRDFGSPLPLPFLYVDWKISPDISAGGLVPVDMQIVYKVSSMIDLGFSMKVRGDRYHGNPDRYDVDNPQLEYSEGTLSPFADINFTKWIHLHLEGGYAAYRNMEFLDGNKSAASYDLEQTGYVRLGLVLGM